MKTRDEQPESLRAEADAMLDAGLHAVLADYGEVHVLGSYALGLMTWRDLDIHIVRPTLDLARHFELGGRLATLLSAPKMNFRDDRTGADPSVPAGLYWGVYLGNERRGAWKLDVWVTEPTPLSQCARKSGGCRAASHQRRDGRSSPSRARCGTGPSISDRFRVRTSTPPS